MFHRSGRMGAEKILIVDDVEANRLILEEIIGGIGCCPVLCDNGKQALELVQKEAPQLILTDISMPVMDGYELCRILKTDDHTKEIPVIFISAFDHPEDIVEGLSLGGDDYITKPFVPEVIEARIGVHLRLGEAKRELLEMNRHLQASVWEQLGQMEQEKKNVLIALSRITAANSGYQTDFIGRLKCNCRILAQGMQLSPLFEHKISDTFIDTIELAAALCDIGYIGIPMEILQKRTGFSEKEAAVKQTHTVLGAEFLKELYANSDYNDFVSMTIHVIRHHHENWDGSGYPDGLAGDEIPLEAQIVSAMEYYCILTEDEACSREEAFSIMEREAGKKINPSIYKICRMISRQFF